MYMRYKWKYCRLYVQVDTNERHTHSQVCVWILSNRRKRRRPTKVKMYGQTTVKTEQAWNCCCSWYKCWWWY